MTLLPPTSNTPLHDLNTQDVLSPLWRIRKFSVFFTFRIVSGETCASVSAPSKQPSLRQNQYTGAKVRYAVRGELHATRGVLHVTRGGSGE